MTKINIKTMKTMLLNGTKLISNNFKYMDELNVFPVPDGDTGTNLKITVEGAAESIQNFDEGSDFLSFGKMYSRGLLMNARGNSGVILSQIFKGFVTDFAKEQKELTISDFCIAITNAKIKAYKSVATPVEGTILTVIRVVDEKLKEKSGSFVSFIDLIDFVCKEAEDILSKTPDFLPELKALNVVDSGGYGLCRFFEGMKKGIHGEQVVVSQDINEKKSKTNNASANFEKLAKKQVDSGFGYCTEFILKLKSKVVVEQEDKIDFDEQEFKKMINLHGDSIVYVKDDNIIKVHIHTINP